jgi:flagellar motor switch protein FliN/FliY
MTAGGSEAMKQLPEVETSGFGDALSGIDPSAAYDDKSASLADGSVDHGRDADPGHELADNSAMIMGLPVMMKVVLGSARMPVAALAKLAKGAVVKLDKMVGDPVEILVNGRLIARGEVVVLNENPSRFGVVLTEVGALRPSQK